MGLTMRQRQAVTRQVALRYRSASRSTKTAAGDNAAMESFVALLQMNVLDRKRWLTREVLRIAIITWIESTYHRRR